MWKSTTRCVLITLLIVVATVVNGWAAGHRPLFQGKPSAAASCGCKCGNCRTVMKTVKEVIYDYEDVTFNRIEYKDVVEKQKVDAVKYVEETAYRCVRVTHHRPEEPPRCEKECGCGSSACSKPSCCPPKMKPVCMLQKVPYTIYKPVPIEEEVEVSRVEMVEVPYTVTRCIPHVICKTVPVHVCGCKAKCGRCGKCRTGGCGCSH